MGRTPRYKLFKNQKHSIKEIERRIGCSPGYLYKFYRGERQIKKIPIKIIIDIAYLEKIEVNTLFKSMLEYEKKRKQEVQHEKKQKQVYS